MFSKVGLCTATATGFGGDEEKRQQGILVLVLQLKQDSEQEDQHVILPSPLVLLFELVGAREQLQGLLVVGVLLSVIPDLVQQEKQ